MQVFEQWGLPPSFVEKRTESDSNSDGFFCFPFVEQLGRTPEKPKLPLKLSLKILHV